MARIAVGGFLLESNCFVPLRMDYEYFARGGEMPPLCRGGEIYGRLTGSSFGMSGFLADMADRHELVPLVWTHGGAGGYVTDNAFERVTGELVGDLSRAMPVDAVYLDLHGAMVTETYEDGEGEIQIGRASCRERVCQNVSISVVAVSLKKKNKHKIKQQDETNKTHRK